MGITGFYILLIIMAITAIIVFAALYCDWRKTHRKTVIFLEKLPTKLLAFRVKMQLLQP